MATDDVLPDVFEEPNCRVAQLAIAENAVVSANSKACDFTANAPKPTEKEEALSHQSNIPDHLQELWEKSSGQLKGEEKTTLLQILCQNQFVFDSSTDDLGRTNLTKHHIDVGCTKPIKQTHETESV